MDVTKEQQLLLNLIRAAIVGDTGFDIPKDVDWQKVIDLSFDQGVASISVDGYNRWLGAGDGSDCALESEELEDLKFEWYGSVLQDETDYAERIKVLQNLTGFLSSNGINVLLLKGLGVGKYYPIPSHRPCGDIDIYLFDDYEKGNEVIAAEGIEINRENSKHSTFTYQGVLVENHKSLLNLDITKAEQQNNEVILSTITDCRDSGQGYLLPSPLTNYLFLLRHMSKHFCETGSITIRHLLDWGLFLNAERRCLDIEKGDYLLQTMGLLQIKDIFVHISQYVSGLDLSFALSNKDGRTELSDIESKFLYDILNSSDDVLPNGLLSRTIYIVKDWYSHKWKFEYLPDDFNENIWARISQTASFKFRELMKGHDLIRKK